MAGLAVLLVVGCRTSAPETRHLPTSMPHGRAYHGVAVMQDQVVLVSGSSEDGTQAACDVFDLRTGTWRRVEDLPTPRDFAGVAAMDGRVYVIGGLHEGRDPVTTVEVLNLQTGTWETAPPLPDLRHRLAAVALDGRIYAIAGFGISDTGEHENVGRVDRYDPATQAWTRVADLLGPRHGHAACVRDGRIVVMGGYGTYGDEDGILTSVQVYDPATDTWSAGPPLTVARGFLAAVDRGGETWTMGGRINGNPIERWARNSDRWELVRREAESRQRFALATLDGLLVAFGCEEAMDDVSTFDPETNTWRTLSDGH